MTVSKKRKPMFVPSTPDGSPLVHLASRTEDEAWAKLLVDAGHMPYDGLQGFKDRGYSVEVWPGDGSE